MIILSISQALHMARSYAEEYDVPWVGATSSRDSRCCRLFPLGEHQFDIDTGGEGPALAVVGLPFEGVVRFEFKPTNPSRFWLPPWAAYPRYSAATMGWRQGSGEVYLTHWVRWFTALSKALREQYHMRFPAPSWGGWLGFYQTVP